MSDIVERGIKKIIKAGIEEKFYRGNKFRQFFEDFPFLSSFYSDFEKSFDPDPVFYWMKENSWLPILSVLMYGLFCFFGQIYMKNRKPFGLKTPLILWNFFLSAFSFYGAIRTVPHLLFYLSSKPLEVTICEEPYKTFGPGSTGVAVQLFILSKIPELFDTVFIVLKKKELIFLHWYHHITVLLFCWHSYVTEAAYGLYFIAMNYTVHAFMYGYFGLMAMQVLPKWFPSWMITLLQISQMFGGTAVVSLGAYYRVYGGEYFPVGKCNIVETNFLFGALIYTTYLYLFVEFAVGKFIFGNKSIPDKASKITKKE